MSGPADSVDPHRWLAFARSDLALAEAGLSDDAVLPTTVCALAQQAVEKSFKALLLADHVDFPKTHTLGALVLLMPEGRRHVAEGVDLERLTFFAVMGRYPGDEAAATREEAGRLLQEARSALDAVEVALR